MTEPIDQLIGQLRRGGVSLLLDGQEVRLRGRLSANTPLIEELKRRKGEVLVYLQNHDIPTQADAEESAPAPASDQPLIDQATNPLFASLTKGDLSGIFDIDRYTERSDAFDRMNGTAEDHFWNPLDSRYLDFTGDFDIETRPVIGEDQFLCLKTPYVREHLADPLQRVHFVNQVAWIRFSTLLHGEQGGLNLSASLCGLLREQGAQEFAANQTREEARHVTAFARYIKTRWGAPAPCLPAMKNFLTEITGSADVSKKIIGLQVMVEGLAMGNLGSLYKRLVDPVGRRLVQLVMTDEAFHHKFGRLWADKTMPSLSAGERTRLEDWTTHCVKDFVFKMNPPIELHVLRREFGLDPLRVAREMQALQEGSDALDTATGARETFRVLTAALLGAGLLSEDSRRVYGAYLDLDQMDVLRTGYDEIVEGGLEYLRGVNADLRKPMPA